MISLTSIIFGSTYSFPALFLAVFLSSYIIIPAVGWVVVSFGAYSANLKDLIYLIVVVYFASVIGDLSVYLLARTFSDKVQRLVRKFKWFRNNEKKSTQLLHKYGFYIVLISRFLPSEASLVTDYISGFSKFNYKKFFIAVLIGELIYAIVYPTIGFIFKDTWTSLINTLEYSLWAVVLVILAIYLAYRIIRSIRKKKEVSIV